MLVQCWIISLSHTLNRALDKQKNFIFDVVWIFLKYCFNSNLRHMVSSSTLSLLFVICLVRNVLYLSFILFCSRTNKYFSLGVFDKCVLCTYSYYIIRLLCRQIINFYVTCVNFLLFLVKDSLEALGKERMVKMNEMGKFGNQIQHFGT